MHDARASAVNLERSKHRHGSGRIAWREDESAGEACGGSQLVRRDLVADRAGDAVVCQRIGRTAGPEVFEDTRLHTRLLRQPPRHGHVARRTLILDLFRWARVIEHLGDEPLPASTDSRDELA